MEVCKAVLTNSNMVVNALIDSHRCALATGKSHISQCSMIVRRRGSMYYEHVGVDMFGDPIIHSTLLDNVSADTVVVYHAPTLIKKYNDGVDEIMKASNLGGLQLALTYMDQACSELANEVL
jgi:hypothetical protein